MGTFSLALPYDDTVLIEEYINGNREIAATQFVRKHQRFVYSLALRQLNNAHDDADDAAQEVFIRALKALPSFKGESSITTWLYRITVNVCSTMRRKKKFLAWFKNEDGEEMEVESDIATPERQMMDKDFSDKFYQILATLPDKQRETFCLRYFDELSYEEISEILGTSIGGLKANYFQAIQKLAKILKNSNMFDLREFGYANE